MADRYRYKVFVKCDKCGHIIEYEYNYELAHPEDKFDPITNTYIRILGPTFKGLPQVCEMCYTANWGRNWN